MGRVGSTRIQAVPTCHRTLSPLQILVSPFCVLLESSVTVEVLVIGFFFRWEQYGLPSVTKPCLTKPHRLIL